MNVSLPAAHLKRLVILVASLQRVAQGDLATRAGNAVKWLEDQLAENPPDNKCLRSRVNSLRKEWAEFPAFNATEEHWFRTWEESLSRLEDADWLLMRDFLAYRPKEREKLWQVEKREWFLKTPQDTLQAARKWQKTHGKGGTVHKLFTGNSQGEGVGPAEVSEFIAKIRDSL